MSQHSPGPWTVKPRSYDFRVENGPHNEVAAVHTRWDADLIAQAPAMLARYRLIADRDCVRAEIPGDMARLCQAAPCDPCFARAILRAVEGT